MVTPVVGATVVRPGAAGTPVAVAAVVRDTGAGGPLRRVRTVLLHPVTGSPAVDEHVRARLTAGQEDRALLGDVLVAHGTGASRAAEVARAHPGALVVAVHRGARCWIRLGPDGTVLEAGAGPGRRHPEAPWEVPGEVAWEALWEGLASLVHSWLAAGLPGAALGSVREFRVQVADAEESPSSRASNCRAASASSVSARPTEA